MNQDNLLREIDEDMERRKYEELWRRYGTYVVAIFALIILVTIVHTYREDSATKAERQATGDLVGILSSKEANDKKLTQLLSFAEDHKDQTQSAIATLHAASIAAKAGDKDKAAKIYDAVAADEKADHAFRQLADLLSVEVQLDTGDVAQLQKRLEPLEDSKEPWHFSAMEMSGQLAIRSGDKAKATEIFTKLSQDASAPASLSARAADILRLLSE